MKIWIWGKMELWSPARVLFWVDSADLSGICIREAGIELSLKALLAEQLVEKSKN